MTGIVGILNVGAGDTKIVFDKDSPQDRIRAARIVKDMIRRGYALLVDSGKRDTNDRPIYTRAYDFDEDKCEYIIADFDPIQAAKEDADGGTDEPTTASSASAPQSKEASLKQRGKRKRVPAESVNAVAVARSAGG